MRVGAPCPARLSQKFTDAMGKYKSAKRMTPINQGASCCGTGFGCADQDHTTPGGYRALYVASWIYEWEGRQAGVEVAVTICSPARTTSLGL